MQLLFVNTLRHEAVPDVDNHAVALHGTTENRESVQPSDEEL